jgi:hypothetical protein
MSQLTNLIPKVAPKYFELLEKTAAEINRDPYRDDILKEMGAIIKKAEARLVESIEKTAGMKVLRPWQEHAKGMMAGVGMMAAGGIALALAGDLYEAAKRGITRGRDYKKMLAANPDLDRPGKAAKVQSSFRTLHRFNPDFAGDPNVAGSYVRQAIELPGSELNTTQSLVKARADLKRSRDLPSVGNMPAAIAYNEVDSSSGRLGIPPAGSYGMPGKNNS